MEKEKKIRQRWMAKETAFLSIKRTFGEHMMTTSFKTL